jgi:branched-chain amino acid transport system substrate-binding protein
VIGTSAVVPGITDIGEYVFRTCLTDSAVIANTIKTLVEKRGLSRVAVMYRNDNQFLTDGYNYFTTALTDNNVTILTTETYAGEDTDFSTQLIKIKLLKPQAVVISGLAAEAANIMIQARKLGMTDVYFIGGNGFNNSQLPRIAGNDADGTVCGIAWFLHNNIPENKQFVTDFGLEYAMDPDQFSAQAYTAAWVLAEAIRKAESPKPDLIRDQLTRIKDFPSPLGKFSFDANREPLYEPVVLIIKKTVFSRFEK